MTRQSHERAPRDEQTRRGARFTLCAALLIVSVGCQSSPRTEDLSRARADYQAGLYALARQRATKAHDRATGIQRDQAMYLAGLCDLQLGNLSEAHRRLTAASHSTHRPTAAKANGALGLVLMRENRPLAAAAQFEQASSALSPEEAPHAAFLAALAYQEAGDDPSADKWFTIARRNGRRDGQRGAGFSSSSGERGRFTLQVGAFRQREHAEHAAAEVTTVADSGGLGPVRIVPIRDERRRKLYLVQFGRFATRGSAADARNRLGNLRFIVAPLKLSNSS